MSESLFALQGMKSQYIHTFANHSFLFVSFGLKCGLIGHRKCIRFLVLRCPTVAIGPRLTLFGEPLDSCAGVPHVMHTCISELERRPFAKLRGIYRTNGNPQRVAQICSSFEFGPQFIDLRHCSHNDITDVLKIYLNTVWLFICILSLNAHNVRARDGHREESLTKCTAFARFSIKFYRG